jgi:CubicO group peptidase (beta-lactamase class C family)
MHPMPAPHEALPAAGGMPAVLEHPIVFREFIFSAPEFPPCDFADPAKAAALFGDYQLHTTFYDANLKPVERPDAPGRYGAVVEIRHATRISRRFVTLCHFDRTQSAIPRALLAARQAQFTEPLAENHNFVPALPPGALQAIRSASLHDLAALQSQNKPVPSDTLDQLDKQWWIEFKRRFYKTNQLFNKPFLPPQPFTGPAAPAARPGSLAHARLKPNALEIIEAAAEKWLVATGPGFAICVAHHGVLAVSKGYGKISRGPNQGQPYMPDTIAPLASTTKFLGAVLFLQFVDQGFVAFDEPAAKYIPALKDLPSKNPPTIRDLYTHSAGLTGHWGDTLNDMEEIIADIYPNLCANAPLQYHGVGHALCGKIMESIAGEPMHRLYSRYLLEPLGCRNSILEKTSYGTQSSATDLVRIGQLMLNQGRFEHLQFFTPPTLRGMLPIPGRDRFEPERNIRWGVGIKILDSNGLSDQAFGGSGACGSFLAIDRARDLVIAHTRFEEGCNYQEFLDHKRNIIQAIKDAIA